MSTLVNFMVTRLDTSPLSIYHNDLACKGLYEDAAQRQAILQLDDLHHRLIAQKAHEIPFLFKWAVSKWRDKSPIKGLYLWGGVGRGKTYLMDTFFEALPFPQKMRTHFHRFMRRIHREMTALKGEKNPLEKVADILAQETRIICFDEFFVSDITDAMILANVLKALFERGVTLVATSNIPPDGLYKEGLQRDRFLPAIKLLQTHLEVINVDGGVDYRLRTLTQAHLFLTPANEQAEEQLKEFFNQLVPPHKIKQQGAVLIIEGRPIVSQYQAEEVIWFNFFELCDGPRSQNDYIEIARDYHTVIIECVPVMGVKNDDLARRFINLIDEFYDRRVKLMLSADAPLTELYREGRLSFEFQRTVSRLLEMQSYEYLTSAHRP